MDKYEYNVKLEQVKKLIRKKDYATAARIADTIDWYRVKNNQTIVLIADVYEASGRYEQAKENLKLAYDRSGLGRQIAYKLVKVCIKCGNIEEAEDFYDDFVSAAPRDISKYLLQYELARAKGEPLDKQISILEQYLEEDMDDRWAFELAKLYHKTGQRDKCIEQCDTVMLWFSDGRYVDKAMDLKMMYTPLTKSQQQRYEARWREKSAQNNIKIEEIKVKEVDVANKYNTQNIQNALKESMEEIFSKEQKKQDETEHIFKPKVQESAVPQPKQDENLKQWKEETAAAYDEAEETAQSADDYIARMAIRSMACDRENPASPEEIAREKMRGMETVPESEFEEQEFREDESDELGNTKVFVTTRSKNNLGDTKIFDPRKLIIPEQVALENREDREIPEKGVQVKDNGSEAYILEERTIKQETEVEQEPEKEESVESEELVEMEEPGKAEELTESETLEETEEPAELEMPQETEELVEEEEPQETEELVEEEEPQEAEELVEEEEPQETEELVEEEEPQEAEELVEEEEPQETEELVEEEEPQEAEEPAESKESQEVSEECAEGEEADEIPKGLIEEEKPEEILEEAYAPVQEGVVLETAVTAEEQEGELETGIGIEEEQIEGQMSLEDFIDVNGEYQIPEDDEEIEEPEAEQETMIPETELEAEEEVEEPEVGESNSELEPEEEEEIEEPEMDSEESIPDADLEEEEELEELDMEVTEGKEFEEPELDSQEIAGESKVEEPDFESESETEEEEREFGQKEIESVPDEFFEEEAKEEIDPFETITELKIDKSLIRHDVEKKTIRQEKPEEAPAEEEEALTNEEIKEIIKDFIGKYSGVQGLDKQMLRTLQNVIVDDNCNIFIMGDAKSGKTSLGIDIIKVVNKIKRNNNRRIAKISADKLIGKELPVYFAKLRGSDLFVENISLMDDNTLAELLDAMNHDPDNRIVVIEDEKSNAEKFLQKHGEIRDYFANRIVVRQNKIKDWVAVAQDYAVSKGYEIDEIGLLALHARIDQLYGVTLVIQKNHVEGIIDNAIKKAEKGGFFKKVFGKKKDKVLTEEHFN